MSRLVLVRHGQAASGWGADTDPGLSDDGKLQAAEMATMVSAEWPASTPVLVSPLRRTRETAAALEQRWGVSARVEPGVGEIPSPEMSLERRARWLPELFQSTWDQAEDFVQEWRQDVLRTLFSISTDAVVVTHFVAINVAVGAATADPRVHTFSPGYCSRTVVETSGDSIEVIHLGGQSATVVR